MHFSLTSAIIPYALEVNLTHLSHLDATFHLDCISRIGAGRSGGHCGGFVGEHLVSLTERLVGGDISNERPS